MSSSAKKQRSLPDNLSDEQEHAWDLAVRQRQNVFITGAAGTGKSHLLTLIIDELQRSVTKSKKNEDAFAVTASTGVAAVNIGGITLHSWASLGIDPAQYHKRSVMVAGEKWKACEILLIDEISMIDAALFDTLDNIARTVRKNSMAFGGIQLIIAGDFLQLPAVAADSKPAFQAECWSKCFPNAKQSVCLAESYRQKQDGAFLSRLHQIRIGHVSEDTNAWLLACVNNTTIDPDDTTQLYTRNVDVDRVNNQRLAALPGEEREFKAKDGCDVLFGFAPPSRANALLQQLQRSTLIPATLQLKVGAEVMLLRNIDVRGGLVNGSQGVVVRFFSVDSSSSSNSRRNDDDDKEEKDDNEDEDYFAKNDCVPVVRFHGSGEERLIWPVRTMMKQKNLTAYRLQVPLRLGWAMTIHKSQGLTLDKACISLSKTFTNGQAYVALSRLRNGTGLRLLAFDKNAVRACPIAVKFYESL